MTALAYEFEKLLASLPGLKGLQWEEKEEEDTPLCEEHLVEPPPASWGDRARVRETGRSGTPTDPSPVLSLSGPLKRVINTALYTATSLRAACLSIRLVFYRDISPRRFGQTWATLHLL
ncbi:hypothetical protein RRG08_028192 [Elysia crispata]|uniref:Uncharacterized protein n=1 Tax=Elysia crispata TaxID=231223 RepID=A0AAE1EBS1_9GAST|nr:hypothetical protein RRG08_028192 [Elysia crispata]